MPIAAWWRDDPSPEISSLPSFSVQRSGDKATVDEATIQRLTGLTPEAIQRRFSAGHDNYVAFLADEPVGYGWAAKRTGGIEELEFTFQVPPRNCYLWDFATLPAWRGRGVYPRLLREIVHQEGAAGIERFWIGYEAGNDASARGIAKAGFRVVGDLVIEDGAVAGLVLFGDSPQALALRDIVQRAILDNA